MYSIPEQTKHNKDKEPRRATFGVEYPTSNITLSKDYYKTLETIEKDEYLVSNKRVEFVKLSSIEGVKFFRCNFHTTHGGDSTDIKSITFRDCSFSECFLGSVSFKDIQFSNCKFRKCDFMHSKFNDCSFINCEYVECSAFFTKFFTTEVDSKQFIKSLIFFKDFFIEKKANDDELHKKERAHKHNTYNISKHLFKSNSDAFDAKNIDIALLEFKKNELIYLIDNYRHQNSNPKSLKLSWHQSITNNHKLLWPIFIKWIILATTKGGTSLIRLLSIAFFAILLSNFIFACSGITSSTLYDIETSNFLVDYLQWLPKNLSIFLGFGFTAFKCTSFNQEILLIGYCSLGIFWYSLLASVLIRKIYK